MDISVITPYFKGKSFMDEYFTSVSKALKVFLDAHHAAKCEIVIVNDSVSEDFDFNYKKYFDNNIEVVIINNKKNLGIHGSRVTGVSKAKGKFIHLLDQDDVIDACFYLDMMSSINNFDYCVSNGYFEHNKGISEFYSNNFSLNFAIKESNHILVRDFIISPGQVLIKKESIPYEWLNNIMITNGTDDYYLWLLAFSEKKRFVSINKCLYTHKSNNSNLSKDLEKMNKSTLEMLSKLDSSKFYDKSDLGIIRRRIKFKQQFKSKSKKTKLIAIVKNIDLFIYNVFYKLVWKGYTFDEEGY